MDSGPPVAVDEQVGRVFSRRLQGFFADLLAGRSGKPVDCIFIRDFEGLPERAPHDIDLIGDASCIDTCLGQLSAQAAAHGLVTLQRRAPRGGALLYLVDLAERPGVARRWAHFEIAEVVKLPGGRSLPAGVVDRQKQGGLYIPSEKWRLCLAAAQALRKPEREKHRRRLRQALDAATPEAVACCRDVLEVGAEDLHAFLATPVPAPAKPVSRSAQRPHPLRRLLRKVGVSRHPAVPFYSVHGPDGVGKTTACSLLEESFLDLPLGLETFHHINVWKHPAVRPAPDSETRQAVSRDRPAAARATLPHRVLQLVYRRLPGWVQGIWLVNSALFKYRRNFDCALAKRIHLGTILVSDRYLQDLWIKNDLNQRTPYRLAGIFYFLHARLVRKPRLAFALEDDPAIIAQRKAQLTPTQIADFQHRMRRLLALSRTRFEIIPVAGRSAEEVAADLARRILEDLGPEAVTLIREHVARHSG